MYLQGTQHTGNKLSCHCDTTAPRLVESSAAQANAVLALLGTLHELHVLSEHGVPQSDVVEVRRHVNQSVRLGIDFARCSCPQLRQQRRREEVV